MNKIVQKVQRNSDVLLIGMGVMFILGILPGTSKMIADAGDAVRNTLPFLGPKTGAK